MMEVTLLSARLLPALVFLVASVAKLADWVGSRQILMVFGVQVPLATPLGILLLAVADLAVAATSIPARSAATGPA
jgi:uncharacterized membrane protein YphA (DoxX/SURF4 family)